MGTSLEELRRFQKAEHVLHRTTDPDDPSGCVLPMPPHPQLCQTGERLRDHLELLRCHYNFLRPHLALKFGHEFRTPAMQAGLTSRRLTFRKIFTSIDNFLCLIRIVWEFILESNSTGQEDSAVSEAA